jgi:uncharacterized circularly permuted ATP-grasp superfamily protein
MALQDAIQTYHDLLTDELAAATQAQLDDQQRRHGLFFGDRPLCTVLRPRFLTPEQYTALKREVGVLLRAFGTAHQAAMADPAVRAQFGLLDWEEALIQLDPGYSAPSPTSRLDTFLLDDGRFSITEYNAETPAAPAYNEALTALFFGLPVMRAFIRRYEVRPLLARHHVLHALLDAYQQWAGDRREPPRIAIVDWREVPTYSEHLLFRDYFLSQGIACITADPREIEYRNGQLVAGDFPITLIYKRVLISELIDRGGLDHPIVRAVKDGAVCMVNSFRCKILHKKASLAVLSDERNAGLFSASERQAIAAHVPWTRLVEQRHTTFGGQAIDLVPFMLEHREHLVLKANDEYGGKGIYLGWQTDAAGWERAIHTALAEPFIVQDRVAIPSESYPSLVDGRLQLLDRIMDTAPFVFYGDFVEGCLTRLSTDALVNVTAGGGSTVPTFVIEPR